MRRVIRYGLRDIVCDVAGIERDATRLRPAEFLALKDISFDVEPGQCLGVVGRNGAGKTTLLKMLQGVLRPDAGSVRLRGRVAALVDLGAGLNPWLSGRENFRLHAALARLPKANLRRALDEVVSFAELDAVIDAPVRTYSSGMRARLGFAMAVQGEPDIVLVDEVLAVGDIGFRARCYHRIAELATRAAIVFVSNSMQQVSRIAERCLVLDRGELAYDGSTASALQFYYGLFRDEDDGVRAGTREVVFDRISLRGEGEHETTTVLHGGCLQMRLELSAAVDVDQVVVDIAFRSADGEGIAQCNNYVRPRRIDLRAGQSVTVLVDIAQLALNPGKYWVDATAMSHDLMHHYDWWRGVCALYVEGRAAAYAMHQLVADWRVEAST